jgi:hypothetical protein
MSGVLWERPSGREQGFRGYSRLERHSRKSPVRVSYKWALPRGSGFPAAIPHSTPIQPPFSQSPLCSFS